MILLTIAYYRTGTTRFVKIGVLVLLSSTTARMLVTKGISGLWTILVVLAIPLVASFRGLSTWKQRRRCVLSPAMAEDCPAHARAKVNQWTQEFLRLGFQISQECWSEWGAQGEVRRDWVRFFAHPSGRQWADIQVVDKSKTMARKLSSAMTSGGALYTSDMMLNQELFPQSDTVIQRAPRSTSTEEMIRKHQALVSNRTASLKTVTDPASVHASLYDAWVERVITEGAFVVREEYVALAPSAIPVTMLRTYAFWLH